MTEEREADREPDDMYRLERPTVRELIARMREVLNGKQGGKAR